MPLKTTQYTDNEPSVIVFGGDHHNTLGVIRALGKSGLPFSVLIHDTRTDNPLICCRYSRYIHKNLDVISNNETEILQYFQGHSLEGQKIPVITTSDFAAYIIDKNYNQLSEHYILPSIQESGGTICKYMDKFAQKKLSELYGIPMAKTWVVHPDNLDVSCESDISLPCICKPVVSAEGSKSDIRVAHTFDEYISIMGVLSERGYDAVLVQEFLNMEYEVVVTGCRTGTSKELIYLPLKKVRRYPKEGGSLTYAESISASQELEKISKVLRVLESIEYNGLFDVEIFKVGDEYYLNEINFRNSGNACTLTGNGVNIAEIWMKDAMGFDISDLNKDVGKQICFMDFIGEIMLILRESESIIALLKSYRDVNTFAKFDMHDLPGSVVWVFSLFRGIFQKFIQKLKSR